MKTKTGHAPSLCTSHTCVYVCRQGPRARPQAEVPTGVRDRQTPDQTRSRPSDFWPLPRESRSLCTTAAVGNSQVAAAPPSCGWTCCPGWPMCYDCSMNPIGSPHPLLSRQPFPSLGHSQTRAAHSDSSVALSHQHPQDPPPASVFLLLVLAADGDQVVSTWHLRAYSVLQEPHVGNWGHEGLKSPAQGHSERLAPELMAPLTLPPRRLREAPPRVL